MQLEDKAKKLTQVLLGYERVAVAFSGGVDSSLLLACALKTLGAGNVLPVFADSCLLKQAERERALGFLKRNGFPGAVELIVVELHPLAWKEFVRNPEDRCYLCKLRIYKQFRDVLEHHGFRLLVDGTNTDDLKVGRPGLRAIRELGVKTPLVEAGFDKSDVREYSRRLQLDTWDMPSASCLFTRIPHGLEVTQERLERIDRWENELETLGFRGCRTKLDSNDNAVVYLELEKADLERLVRSDMRTIVVHLFRKQGVNKIYLDLAGR